MPLSIEQYAAYLDTRNLAWPIAPPPVPAKARAHLPRLAGIRAVLWNVYGTLIRISGGELKFELDDSLVFEIALEKTIHEFKMWNAMSRKPGQPSAYMREIYLKVLKEIQLLPSSGERYPEIASERIWESIVKKLFQKEYQFDAGFYGSLNEFAKKIAFFFHSSLQGVSAYEHAGDAIKSLAEHGLVQGLLADGQCFTYTQLGRCLKLADESFDIQSYIKQNNCWISVDHKCRKPSENLFRSALRNLAELGIESTEVLHVGSNLSRDIAPAKKLGMHTALFAGDKNSLSATVEQMKDPHYRPDVLLTELHGIAQVIG